MAEWAKKQAVGVSATDAQHALNIYFEEADPVNGSDFGMQGFVYKKIFDAGVATVLGCPVGDVAAAGGGTVTPDISDVNAGAIKGRGGGLTTFVTALNVTAYGWVQNVGYTRYSTITTGAVAAEADLEWTDDLTIAAFTNAKWIFGKARVAAAGTPLRIAAGGVMLFGN